jgi:cytochrome c oxidase cbb3-type subunit 2
MNRLSYIFIGFLTTFFTAWLGLAVIPSVHYQESDGAGKPEMVAPLVVQGQGIYRQNGCVYCHSQQISARNFRSDQARGWGSRRTVASDYRSDRVGLFGTMRTGPDLANIGRRNPSAQWHYLHLYNPQLTSKGSTMPPFPFLFQVRATPSTASADGIPLNNGTEIVPKSEAKALVAYILSLKHDEGNPPEAFEQEEE